MTRKQRQEAYRRAMERRARLKEQAPANGGGWEANNSGLSDRNLKRLINQGLGRYGLKLSDDLGFIQIDYVATDDPPARNSVTLRQQFSKVKAATPAQPVAEQAGQFPVLLIAALAGGAYLLGSK